MVEPADAGALKAADGSDLRLLPDAQGVRELLKRGDRLIARIADHDVGDDVRVVDNPSISSFAPHERRSAGVSTGGGRLVSLVPCQTAADQCAHRVPPGMAFAWVPIPRLAALAPSTSPVWMGCRNLDGLPATRNPR
jgi:hypothetical protein